MNIYDVRRLATATFLIISLAVVGVFLYLSNLLVDDLSAQERARMQIWAGATKQIADIGNGEPDTSLDFLLSILEENRNIPVILTDDSGTILDHRNFNLPEPIDSLNPLFISEVNAEYLPPPDLYKKAILFVLDTPNRYREVIKRLAAHQHHGNFTPGRFSVGCSHCLRRLHAGKRYHARTVTEQEYRPIAGHGLPGAARN